MDYKKDLFEFMDKNSPQANKEIIEIDKKINKAKAICLFGAELNGQGLAYYLNTNKIKINFFCDNNLKLWDKNICLNIPCISPDKLKNISHDDTLTIISSRYYKEIGKQLTDLGFNNFFSCPSYLYLRVKKYLLSVNLQALKQNISNLIDILGDDHSKIILVNIIKNWFSSINNFIDTNNWEKAKGAQYFPQDIIKLKKDEVFVDVGAFDGDTVALFIKESCSKFNKIISYELDKNNYLKLLENVNRYEPEIKSRIVSHNMGLMNENKIINYFSGSTSAVIDLHSSATGQVVKLSEHLKNISPTYIKMDIEGAEFDALMGAEEIIKTCKPKLAVCVYHNPEHFWHIPFYIKRIAPEYRIYLRHHSLDITETVCYAIT